MPKQDRPVAIVASEAPLRARHTVYPEPFASRMAGRFKRPLGDLFGLTRFGVNLTVITPRGQSALRHAHTQQDEFVYVLKGRPTLVTDEGETQLAAGMCAGFKAGTGNAHCIVNRTDEEVVLLEMGDRTSGDEAVYPDDDIQAAMEAPGKWHFTKKNGTPY
jgi:uncharacterized cupin superfamily protein